MSRTQITFQPASNPGPPEMEAVREVFSAISYVRDRLQEVSIEHDYTAEQQAAFEAADELLREAHRTLRRSIRQS